MVFYCYHARRYWNYWNCCAYCSLMSPVFMVLLSTVVSLINAQETKTKGPPHLLPSYRRDHVTRAGDTARLLCPVESASESFLSWTKDRQTIHSGWERYRLLSESLRIKNSDPTDSGIYICKATNGFGSVEVTLRLYVYDQSNSTAPSLEDFNQRFQQTDSAPVAAIANGNGRKVTLTTAITTSMTTIRSITTRRQGAKATEIHETPFSPLLLSLTSLLLLIIIIIFVVLVISCGRRSTSKEMKPQSSECSQLNKSTYYIGCAELRDDRTTTTSGSSSAVLPLIEQVSNRHRGVAASGGFAARNYGIPIRPLMANDFGQKFEQFFDDYRRLTDCNHYQIADCKEEMLDSFIGPPNSPITSTHDDVTIRLKDHVTQLNGQTNLIGRPPLDNIIAPNYDSEDRRY